MHITSTGGLLKIIVLNDNFEINRNYARSHFKHWEMTNSDGVKDDIGIANIMRIIPILRPTNQTQ